MAEREKDAYILGTDYAELQRLGLQHQVWASEAHKGWRLAGFTQGHTLLDLGCGPGFCTKELAYIAGDKGKVIAVDLSSAYIDYVNNISAVHGLNVETMCTDFDKMILPANSIDGMYCRWAMAWVPNPKEVLAKVLKALKPGGKMVLHEYYDWSIHKIHPEKLNLKKCIAKAFKSFDDSQGNIDVGRELPVMLSDLGMKLTSVRPMSKLTRPSDMTWQWPKTFYENYFPKLIEAGYLDQATVDNGLNELKEIEHHPGATMLCPALVEVIAEKVG